MIRKLVVLAAVCGVFGGVAGCATFTPTGITYHHGNPATDSFWMTTIKINPSNGSQTATLWRCTNYSDGPACVQAKLVRCPSGADCQESASQIFQTDLGSYHAAPVAPLIPEK